MPAIGSLSMTLVLSICLSVVTPFSFADEDLPSSNAIRNGCISTHLIRKVDFTSATEGTITLQRNRQVKITLRNRCSGIQHKGYIHKPINNQLCQGDILRVIEYGNSCVVDTLTPITLPLTTETPEATNKEKDSKVTH